MSEMPAMSDTTTNTLPAPANDDPWSAASAPAETAAPAADPWGASDAASTASSSAHIGQRKREPTMKQITT